MNERALRAVTIAIVLALLLFYAALAIAADRGHDPNRRAVTLLSLGSEASSRSGNVTSVADDLRIAADAGSGTATWDDYSYQVTHLTNHARSCTMSVAFVGLALSGATTRGSADILVNGNVIRRIDFSDRSTGLFPYAPKRFVPRNIVPESIELVPLDPEYGFVAPIPAKYCAASSFSIGVRVAHATWEISRAVIILAYTPKRSDPRSAWKTILLGGVCAAALLASLCLVISRIASIGVVPLIAATLLLALSPLTYDQWDFRLWLNFAEVAVFGAGDPAYLWKGSPLWAFVPSLFSSITSACYALTGHGSAAFTALSLKIAMAIAYCYSAYQIAMRAPSRLRRPFALGALLLPVGLFELGAGYREIFASAAVISSLVTASRGKLSLSTTLAAVAASISEIFAPMLLLPATLALTGNDSLRRRLVTAITLAALGVILVAGQWLLLLPHDLATNAFGFRFGAAHFGGASWAGALQRFQLLPDWLPAGSPLLGAFVYGVLAILPAVRCVRVVKSRSVPYNKTFDEIVAIYTALVAAFLMAFRGSDPNLWYAVTIVALWYFARAQPSNPFPLLLGSVAGLAFYATVGFREFVNQAYFWPVDHGLLGVLSTSHYVFVLTIDGLLIALIATTHGSPLQLFSRNSPKFIILFAAAVAATAIGTYALDIIICVAGAACVLATFMASIAGRRRYRTLGGLPFGSCDVVLAAGGLALLCVQPGAGLISRIGWIALVSSLLGFLAKVVIDIKRRRPARPR